MVLCISGDYKCVSKAEFVIILEARRISKEFIYICKLIGYCIAITPG